MAEEENKQAVITRKLYIKDSSFEAPNTPQIFRAQGQPNKNVDINNIINQITDDDYEVVASLTVTAKLDDKTAYLAEVHQAGIFTIRGFEKEEIEKIRHTYCMQILYPYACVSITDLVVHGGFPPLILEPMNFNQLYARKMQKDEPASDETG